LIQDAAALAPASRAATTLTIVFMAALGLGAIALLLIHLLGLR